MTARLFFIIGFLSLMLTRPAHGDDSSTLPGAGFSADRYATLWTKSPFAIATPEAGAASQDFELVGLAQFDGVSYASLIDKQSNEHFVLSSDKPARNLTLVSISHSQGGATATIQRNGELLTLTQEEAPASAPGPVGAMPTPQVLAPGAPLSSVGGVIPPAYLVPPRARVHRPGIRVPPHPSP
jgi:hypothetical protein